MLSPFRAHGWLCLLFGATSVDAMTTLSCQPTDPHPIEHAFGAGSAVYVFGQVPDGALYEIEETGVDLEVQPEPGSVPQPAATAGVHVGHRPARLGITLAPAQAGQQLRISSRSRSSTLPVAGRLRLHCQADDQQRRLAQCLTKAEQSDSVADAEAVLVADPGHCAAFAAHSAASARFRLGHQADAEYLFRLALQQWQSLDDPARAGAAAVGLSESLARQGRHEESLTAADEAARMSRTAGIGYFVLRATNQRCLALRNLGRLQQADTCLQPLAQHFLDLGETSEAANVLFNIAAMAREDRRNAAAAQALARLRALPADQLSPLVTGRAAHVAAGLHIDAGQVHDALQSYETALAQFEQVPSAAWVAHTHMAAARLHASLGAEAEALLLTSSAERGYESIQMHESQALAMLQRARIEAERGQSRLALARADRAAALLNEDGSAHVHLDAALLAWSLEPTTERATRVERIAATGLELTPRLHFDLAMTQARNALAAQDPQQAVIILRDLEDGVPDLTRQIAYERVMAHATADAGDVEAARDRLDAGIDRLLQVVARIGAPALRQIAGRRLLQLRATWIDTLPPTGSEDPILVDRIAGMLLRTQPGALLRAAAVPQATADADAQDDFDRALARVLLANERDDSHLLAAQRAVWNRYLRSPTGAAESVPSTTAMWAERSAGLAPDQALLLIGLGERQSVAVLARHDHAVLHMLPPGILLRNEADALIDLASQRGTPIQHIEAAALALSHSLLPVSADPVPQRLSILVDESLAAVPFALLHWPGRADPLIDSTRVSLVLPTATNEPAAEVEHRATVHVLVAAKAVATDEALPRLHGAEQEPGWIKAELRGRNVDARPLTGDALRAALRSRQAWVHVAGHGHAHAGLQGYSGLWADPADDDTSATPRFISWLSLVDQPIRADLVVLNACTLGSTGASQSNRASSFAAAIQAAGAAHVVAALWPASDGAAALWVPTFYASLGDTAAEPAPDPIGALREAQLRLRQSRSFRHPFYWASLVHYTRL